MQRLAPGIRRLDVQDQRIMPWKNGGGSTRELALHPQGAGINAAPFLWRVSIADVKNDGPFSAFPGYERSIMLIEGAGMELRVADAAPVRISDRYRPWRFTGDAHTECRLLDGPVRDFNVMSAREKITQHCEAIAGGPMEALWKPDTETLFCHCLHGTLIVKLRGVAESSLTAGQSLWLSADEIAGPARVLFAPNSPGSVGILVTLRDAVPAARTTGIPRPD